MTILCTWKYSESSRVKKKYWQNIFIICMGSMPLGKFNPNAPKCLAKSGFGFGTCAVVAEDHRSSQYIFWFSCGIVIFCQ